MKNENLKQAIISIIIGAGVAFFSTLFTELAQLFKTHSTEIIAGISSSAVYVAKAYKG